MEAHATFTVSHMTHIGGPPNIRAGLAITHSHMVKSFDGQIEGRALTEFTGAFDHATSTGTYVAMESFEGSVNGLEGTFLFAHINTVDHGALREEDHMLVIVPTSGTHELTGICGRGAIQVDGDGTHHLTLSYEFTR